MRPVHKAYFWLHISVICWSFTAILGALINVSAVALVWWRVLLTSLFLLLVPRLYKSLRALDISMIRGYAFIGVLIGLHWICFYASIKVGNASVALITLATTSIFTALLEPLIIGYRPKAVELILASLIVPAMYLVVAEFDAEMITAFWLGILSAILLAYSSVLNKKKIHHASPLSITFIEMISACVFISIAGGCLYRWVDFGVLMPVELDWLYLLLLVVFCTILPYILHLFSLRYISAFTMNLVVNLEPVYGILLAVLILGEQKDLDVSFYLGMLMIFAVIFFYSIYTYRSDSEYIDPSH